MDAECQSIVIEYLIHNCFKNTVNAFIKERRRLQLCSKPLLINGDLKKLPTKGSMDNGLVQAVRKGDITLAFELIQQYFPSLTQDSIPSSEHVLFKLKCQQFIEIIRSSCPTSELEAIRYAQMHLKPIHSRDKELVKEVTALIAYTDPYKSQSKYLLTQERREQLASELNYTLLAYCDLPVETSIEKLTKQYSVVQQELEDCSSNCSYREKLAI
ncbi:Glucose-induced degradation protein 8 [Choanephora cucurbitarum]|uniref:Glucose-induced degradation protein 8 n=1 Tax=Choanephora cucurbitarum TaxID=101091 RepID=A0A1C7NQA8_9FUNG|nr:Glucose-induced degradation protein 8 [Choanephora cucurbitarum]